MTQVGDKVWFGNGTADLWEAKVVHILKLDGWIHDHYILEVSTHIDPLLYVRDESTISPDAEGPLNWLRRIRKR